MFFFADMQVIGDVASADGKPGNIEISLASDHPHSRFEGKEAPVTIEEGSKRLVLTRKLDKEGPEGEQGIVVGIQCRKVSNPNEPSIIIPVRIIITDANDHAPEFQSAPYSTNISEVAIVGSNLLPPGTIRAVDHDQPGAFSTIEYYIESGPFSHLARFENAFTGNLLLAAPLDYETLPKFWITIRAQDQGEPPNTATTTVTVNVIDADDQNPRFLDDKYIAILPENNKAGERLNITPRAFRAVDPDTGINSQIELSFGSSSDARETAYFGIDSRLGEVTLKKPLPSSISLPLTLVIKAMQVDNRDRYALTTLTVQSRRQPKPALKFLQSNYSVSLLENFPPGHLAVTVRTNRPDVKRPGDSESLSFQLIGDEDSHFEIRNTGEIFLQKALDYETRRVYNLRVRVTDGKQSDTAAVDINVDNVNDHDPQFGENHYNFFVSEARLNATDVVGDIKATDADFGDNVSLSIRGPFATMFTISNEGILRISSLQELNTTQCHLIVVARDSGSPARSSSVPVTVQFPSSLFKPQLPVRTIDDGMDQQSFSEAAGGTAVRGDLSRRERMHDHVLLKERERSPSAAKEAVDVNVLFNANSSSAIVLVIVLGVLLATLFIIIITLTVHVLKQRKFGGTGGSSGASSDSSGSASPTSNPYHQYYQTTSRRSSAPFPTKSSRVTPVFAADSASGDPVGTAGCFNPPIVPGLGSRGVENPIFSLTSGSASNMTSRYYSAQANAGRSCNSDPESGILSDTSSQEHKQQRQEQQTATEADDAELVDIRSRCSSTSPPPPPPLPPSVTCTTIGPGQATTASLNASRISVVKWPQGSIPRRVKKLTWEDETKITCLKDDHSQKPTAGSHTTSSQMTCDSHADPSSSSSFAPASENKSTVTTGIGQSSSSSSSMPAVGASSPTPPVLRESLVDSFQRNVPNASGLPDLTVYF
jgi:hypothetical protein